MLTKIESHGARETRVNVVWKMLIQNVGVYIAYSRDRYHSLIMAETRTYTHIFDTPVYKGSVTINTS